MYAWWRSLRGSRWITRDCTRRYSFFLRRPSFTLPSSTGRFVQGDARGSEVINHLNAQRALREPRQVASDLGRTLDWLEAAAYFADDPTAYSGN